MVFESELALEVMKTQHNPTKDQVIQDELASRECK